MLRHIEPFVTFRYVDTVAGWLGGWPVHTSYYCMQAVDTIDGIITAPQVYSAGTYIPHLTLHRPYLALPGWGQKWKWLKTPLACCGETHIS
jgi:hypothetical protein